MKQTLGTPSERQLHGHPKACPSWAPADGGHSGMSQVTVRSGALCQRITCWTRFPLAVTREGDVLWPPPSPPALTRSQGSKAGQVS